MPARVVRIARSNLADVLCAVIELVRTVQNRWNSVDWEELLKVVHRGDKLKALDGAVLHQLQGRHSSSWWGELQVVPVANEHVASLAEHVSGVLRYRISQPDVQRPASPMPLP